MNFTMDNKLLSIAASEMASANTLIANLKSQSSSLKEFPPDYEYQGQVNEAISNLDNIFKEINEVSQKFCTFLSTRGMIKEFSLVDGSLSTIDIGDSNLNLNMSDADSNQSMINLINYYNYLNEKGNLTPEEKKTYDALYSYVKSNDIEKFLNIAADINKHYRKDGVTYSTGSGIYMNMNDSKNSDKTCCATYVAQTLYDYNQEKYARYNSGKINYNYCQTLYNDLKQDGSFKEVDNINDLQPGDIVFMRNKQNDYSQGIQHVQIYAGNNTWYNAGSNDSIQKGKYKATDQNHRYVVAMRPDFKNNDVSGDDK